MSTSTITGVVGAVIGGFATGWVNPQGYYYGFMIGSAIGGAYEAANTVIPGPRVGDAGQQTSQEGGPIPIVFGLSPPISGNLISCQPEPDIVKTRESQSKSGPKVETETAYRTYAIGFSEGECEFVRVWKNNTLVYDANDPGMAANNAEFLKVARFYTGSYDQMPSPDLEAVFGAGNVHAFRGRCYMVLAREDVTRMDGAASQYTVQLWRGANKALATPPYPIEFEDTASFSMLPIGGRLNQILFSTSLTDDASFSMLPIGGTLSEPLTTYATPDDASFSMLPISGQLKQVLTTYMTPDDASFSMLPIGGTLSTPLFTYDRFNDEASFSMTPLGGMLWTP